MVRQNIEAHSDWQECTPGTIGDLRKRLNADRRRRSIARIGGPIVVMAVLAMGVWTFGGPANSPTRPQPLQEFNFGSVTCSEFQASMQPFAMEQLSPAQQQAFALHLQQCPVCQAKMKAVKKAEMPRIGKNLIGNSSNGFQTHRTLLASNVD